MDKVRVLVEGYTDSDLSERADLADELHDELLGLDVDNVSSPPSLSPLGAKGGALQWAELVVTFAGSLPALLTAVSAWVGRHPGASVTVEKDGDKLSLRDPSAEERRELIEAWVGRHGR